MFGVASAVGAAARYPAPAAAPVAMRSPSRPVVVVIIGSAGLRRVGDPLSHQQAGVGVVPFRRPGTAPFKAAYTMHLCMYRNNHFAGVRMNSVAHCQEN